MHLGPFFAQYPVFTHEEFKLHAVEHGSSNVGSQHALLEYHIRTGHIIRVRRGLFAVVPALAVPDKFVVDPYLLASRLKKDAILAYHTALELHGVAHSVFHDFYYLTEYQTKPFHFHGQTFCGVKPKNQSGFENIKRQGLSVQVTTIERTFVDVIDKPQFCGGWEEVCRSLEGIAVLNPELVIEYVRKLGSAMVAAKVGFFLEQYRTQLGLEDKHITPLEAYKPKQALYLDRSKREPGRFIKRWNLIVPITVLEHSWEEPQAVY